MDFILKRLEKCKKVKSNHKERRIKTKDNKINEAGNRKTTKLIHKLKSCFPWSTNEKDGQELTQSRKEGKSPKYTVSEIKREDHWNKSIKNSLRLCFKLLSTQTVRHGRDGQYLRKTKLSRSDPLETGRFNRQTWIKETGSFHKNHPTKHQNQMVLRGILLRLQSRVFPELRESLQGVDGAG